MRGSDALADAGPRAAHGGPEQVSLRGHRRAAPEYGDAVDLPSPGAQRTSGRSYDRWTYNGGPPRAGAMVLDAQTPGMRTWGWIAYRWKIPVWYVWTRCTGDRHNRRSAASRPRRRSGHRLRQLLRRRGPWTSTAYSLPASDGCRRTLRLASLRRGFQDRALLELAARCDPAATARLAAELVPRALGDAPDGAASWPADEAAWELARRKLLTLASCP
jgi:hypothetical protein